MVRHRRISGSALRWERMHRDAAKALAAQAAEAMAARSMPEPNPSPAAGEVARPDAQAARTGQGASGA
jgi:hypothetical protein